MIKTLTNLLKQDKEKFVVPKGVQDCIPITAIYDDGERLPATYANFLVINGAVLCPTYDQPDLDAEALRLIGEAFPGRDIIGIDCRSIIRQHGSLHCCTMQYPEGIIPRSPISPTKNASL